MRFGGRKLAPINPALSASDSADPSYWRDAAAIWPLFYSQSMRAENRWFLPVDVIGYSRRPTILGPGQYQPNNDSDDQLQYDSSAIDRSGIGELTFVAWCIPDVEDSASGSNAMTLAGNTSANNDGIRAFLAVNSTTARWRLPQAGGNCDIEHPFATLFGAGNLVQYVGRLGGGTQDLTIYDATRGVENFNSIATSSSITFDEGNIWIGQQDDGSSGSLPGAILWAGLYFRRWSDEEIVRNRADVFAPFRRKTFYTVVEPGDITGSGTLQSDDSTTSGTGEITKTGSGTLTSDDSTMSGSGSVEGAITGEGDLFSGNSTTSGTAEITKTGSGTLVSDDSTMSGSGNVGEAITGSGDLVSDDSTISGTAEREITASGTLQSDDSTLSGTGERIITAQVFDLFSGNSTMDGEAGKSINGSGDMESGDSTMDGGEEVLDFDTLAAFILVQNGLTGHIDDRLRQFLVAKGFTDDLHNYDLFDDYLLSLGFTDEALWDKYYDATKDGFLWTQGL